MMDIKHNFFILLILILGIVIVFGPTMLDYIGNHIMYKHGLEFSWDWYLPWGIGLHLSVLGSAVSTAIIYWVARGNTLRNRITAFMIGLTGYWQLISGNEDFIWFAVFDGGIPPLDKILWWMPQDWLLQWLNPSWRWTTFHELIWIAIFNVILIGLWILWKKRNI